MCANIVRRRPPVRPTQPFEQRPTREITEQQLDELILDHTYDRFQHAHDDLEAEVELVATRPDVLPEATPIGMPSTRSLRLAHTLPRVPRRAVRPAVRPAKPPPTPAVRPARAAPAPVARPAKPPPTPVARSARAAPAPVARLAGSAPASEPAMLRVSKPVLAPPKAVPPAIQEMDHLLAIDIAPREPPVTPGTPIHAAPSTPLADSGTAMRARFQGRARLLLLVPLLLALGTAAYLLQ
jgi:hypothetical protein